MKIVVAFIIFSAVILFHELGHFLMAKASHIVVTEFSLGMGPRIFSIKKGETRYSLKALPFGGSCAMLGEDMEDNGPGTFAGASVWHRILTVAAGPGFNFILAFILSLIIVCAMGSDDPTILTVAEDSAAYEAGLREGDILKEYNGYHVDLGRDWYVYSTLNPLDGTPVQLKVKRDGETLTITYDPDEEVRYLLGFNRENASSLRVNSLIEGLPLADTGVQAGDVITSIDGYRFKDGDDFNDYLEEHPLSDTQVTITYERAGLEYEATLTPGIYRTYSSGFVCNIWSEKVTGPRILKYAVLETKYMIRTTLLSLKELFTGGVGLQDLSGPVGVVDAIGDTYETAKREGMLVLIVNLLNMAVLLSANLGVMNLLPIPALDGGRLLFLLVEAVRGKPGNQKVEGYIHFAGLMMLMGLMVIIMYNDIVKLF